MERNRGERVHHFDPGKSSPITAKNGLTLFTPAYFGISGTGGGHIVPPLSILGLGGVRVPILFGNDLPMND